MPRRNVLSTRDTNSRPYPPPGVILSHGTWGIPSIDPNYKPPVRETKPEPRSPTIAELVEMFKKNDEEPRFYSGQELLAIRRALNDEKQTTSKQTKQQVASKATFSEGSWGLLTEDPKDKPKKKVAKCTKRVPPPQPATFDTSFSEGDWGLLVETPKEKPDTADTEAKGVKRKADTTNSDKATVPKRSKKVSASDYPKDTNNLIDVSSVYLDDEEYEEVPIYATATDIRRELTTLLQTPGVSTAGLCRTLSAASGVNISAQRLNTFRNKGKKGAATVDGTDSPVFYAAYVYVEKVRVLTGGKKSKHRLEMEEAWGDDGMSREGLQKYVSLAHSTFDYDRLGRMVMDGWRVCDHSNWRSRALFV